MQSWKPAETATRAKAVITGAWALDSCKMQPCSRGALLPDLQAMICAANGYTFTFLTLGEVSHQDSEGVQGLLDFLRLHPDTAKLTAHFVQPCWSVNRTGQAWHVNSVCCQQKRHQLPCPAECLPSAHVNLASNSHAA